MMFGMVRLRRKSNKFSGVKGFFGLIWKYCLNSFNFFKSVYLTSDVYVNNFKQFISNYFLTPLDVFTWKLIYLFLFINNTSWRIFLNFLNFINKIILKIWDLVNFKFLLNLSIFVCIFYVVAFSFSVNSSLYRLELTEYLNYYYYDVYWVTNAYWIKLCNKLYSYLYMCTPWYLFNKPMFWFLGYPFSIKAFSSFYLSFVEAPIVLQNTEILAIYGSFDLYYFFILLFIIIIIFICFIFNVLQDYLINKTLRINYLLLIIFFLILYLNLLNSKYCSNIIEYNADIGIPFNSIIVTVLNYFWNTCNILTNISSFYFFKKKAMYHFYQFEPIYYNDFIYNLA